MTETMTAPVDVQTDKPVDVQAVGIDDEDAGFMLLAEAVVQRAKADAVHECTRHCRHKKQCQRARFQARIFLSDLRASRGAYWVRAWITIAAKRAGLTESRPTSWGLR